MLTSDTLSVESLRSGIYHNLMQAFGLSETAYKDELQKVVNDLQKYWESLHTSFELSLNLSEIYNDAEALSQLYELIDSNNLNVATLHTGQYNKLLQAVGLSASSSSAELQRFIDSINQAKSATLEEASALIEEAECSDVARQYLAQLTLQKLQGDKITIQSKADVQNLYNIAKAAGATRVELLK